MCLLTACLPVCLCVRSISRPCVRAYMLGHAHIAHVRTCTHIAHAHAHLYVRTVPACPCLPADQVKPPVCTCAYCAYPLRCLLACVGHSYTRTHGRTYARALHARTARTLWSRTYARMYARHALHARRPTRTRPRTGLAQNQGRNSKCNSILKHFTEHGEYLKA